MSVTSTTPKTGLLGGGDGWSRGNRHLFLGDGGDGIVIGVAVVGGIPVEGAAGGGDVALDVAMPLARFFGIGEKGRARCG